MTDLIKRSLQRRRTKQINEIQNPKRERGEEREKERRNIKEKNLGSQQTVINEKESRVRVCMYADGRRIFKLKGEREREREFSIRENENRRVKNVQRARAPPTPPP